MTILEFLQQILPPDSPAYFYCDKDESRPGNNKVKNYTARSLVQLARVLEKQILAHNKHWYIASAGYTGKTLKSREARPKGADGQRFWNIIGRKSYHADVDFGPGKHYPTKKALLEALRKARKKGMPWPTIIIDTGNGVHLWWVLDAVVSPSEWEPVAKQLETALTNVDFPPDTGICSDAIRLMRFPGSPNVKDPSNIKTSKQIGKTGPTYTQAEMAGWVEKMAPQARAGIDLGLGTAVNPNDLPPELQVGEHDLDGDIQGGKDLPPRRVENIVKQCPLFKHLAETGGANYTGNVWFNAIVVAAHCEDGEEWAHKLSNQHMEYNEQDTADLYENKVAKVEADEVHPTKCDTFQSHLNDARIKSAGLPNHCDTCEFRNKAQYPKFNSPISLARWTLYPDLPWPYKNTEDGMMQQDGVGGEWFVALPYRAIGLHLCNYETSEGRKAHVQFQLIKPRIGTVHTICTPYNDVHDTKSLNSVLAGANIMLGETQRKALQKLMPPWVQQVEGQSKGPTAHPNHVFGWVDNGDFLFGNRVLHKAGGQTTLTVPAAQTAHVEYYTPKGAAEPWTQAANHMLSQLDRPAIAAIIASAFASPLVKFIGGTVHGVIISAFSPESGTGKSAAMTIAQAAWGNPQRIRNQDDTASFVGRHCTDCHTMPVYWDEIQALSRKSKRGDELIEFIQRYPQGQERGRMQSNQMNSATRDWINTLLLGTNQSLIDYAQKVSPHTDASMMRIFEIQCPKFDDTKLSKVAFQQMITELKLNHGHAAAQYMEWLVIHQDEARRLLIGMQEKVAAKCAELGVGNAGRFWEATISVLVVGAHIAKQLGIADFDVVRLYKYLISVVAQVQQRQQVSMLTSQATPIDCVDDFLRANAEHIVFCETMPGQGTSGDGAMMPDRAPIKARVAHKDGIMWLHQKDFKDYMNEAGVGATHIFNELEKMGAQLAQKKSLGAGLPKVSTNRDRCVIIDTRQPAFNELAPSGVTQAAATPAAQGDASKVH